MRRITPRALWIGHVGDLISPASLIDGGVEAVVELADSEQFAHLPRGLIRIRFPLSDGGANPPHLLRLAAETTAGLLREGVAVLVTCSAGMSRSICIAASGIALAEGIPFAQAVAEVASFGPADVSPALFLEIRESLGAEHQ